MAIGRVAGNMLMSDLDRLGVDLQITTGSNPLFYLDLSNFRAVINGNASTATETFTVFGSAKLDDIVVSQSTISSATNITITAPQIDLGNLNNLIIAGGSPDYILTTNGLGVLSWQDITNLVPDLVTYVDIAIAKAGEASASASAALTSETNAATSATTATTKAGEASASAAMASTKANEAATSATNAATSAAASLASKNEAATSANAAANSEANALNAKNSASASATDAATSAGIATAQADAAAASAGSVSAAVAAFYENYPGSYGVSWDESTDTFTQVGSSTAHVALPIQSRMRRCLLDDAGQVAAYLDANNSNYLSSGNPATLTGAAGQVMVEVPKFWIAYSYVGTVHTWLIADTPLPGFSVHPDFIKDGVEVVYRYYGAYDANIVGGKIQSVSGAYPTISKTRAQFRTAAAARGAGWRQLTYTQWSSVLLLALVEFKTFDFKTSARMTAGRTTLSGGAWTNGSYLALSGLSNSLGNKTGGVSLGGASGILTDFMSYRGIENFFGHVWQFLDGFTVDMTANNAVTPVPLWFTNNSAYFADSGSVGMTSLGSMPNLGASANGYVATLMANLACGFIGASIGATSSTKFRSYLWQYPDNGNNWRAPSVGGRAEYGVAAAPGSLNLHTAASGAAVEIGGRAGF